MGMYNSEPITEFGLKCEDKSLTKQSFKDDCDVDKIIKNYSRTGDITLFTKSMGQSGDFSAVQDFHTAMNLVANASSQFNSLPSALRDRFNNSIPEFLSFMNDDKNIPEAIKLGIIDGKVIEKTPPTGGASSPVKGDSGAPGTGQ